MRGIFIARPMAQGESNQSENLPRKLACEISASKIWRWGENIKKGIKESLFLIRSPTCAGADINPTAIPQITRPTKIIVWLSASAIEAHPTRSGPTDNSRAFFRPWESMIGTEASDPIGVANEWIDAEKVKSFRSQFSLLPGIKMYPVNWILMSERLFLRFMSNLKGIGRLQDEGWKQAYRPN